MAKVNISEVDTNSRNTTINNNFNALATAIENTVSRDGTAPNHMSADIDVNSNDILNVNTLQTINIDAGAIATDALTVAGVPITGNSGTGNGISYIEPSGSDDSVTLQAAIDALDYYETLKLKPGGVYCLGAELYFGKPVIFDLNGATLKPCPGYNGYLISVNATRLGIIGLYWQPGSVEDWPWKTLPDNNWMTIKNGFLEGNARQQDSNGIVFRGGNSEVLLDHLLITNFRGHGIAVCDPYSYEGEDASNQYIQESLFHDLYIGNCGTTGKPSVIIGRNNSGLSNHNNLRWEWCSFVYGRDAEVCKIINENTATTNGRIQEVQFENCFFHGNRSLANPDAAGNSTPANADLIVIGQSGVTGTQKRIRNVFFRDCRIIEAEDAYSSIAIKQWTNVTVTGGQLSCTSTNKGISMNGAGNVLVDSVLGFDNENLMVIDGEFAFGGRLTIGSNPSQNFSQYTGPNLVFNASSWASVIDTTGHVVAVPISGDVQASDTLPASGVTFVYDTAEFEMLVRAWFLPSADLTADDTDYASIIIRPYNANGTVRATHTATTKTTASGGTGDWTANTKVDLGVPSDTVIPGALSFNINKSGNGVVIPSGLLCFQFSKTVYI